LKTDKVLNTIISRILLIYKLPIFIASIFLTLTNYLLIYYRMRNLLVKKFIHQLNAALTCEKRKIKLKQNCFIEIVFSFFHI